MSFIFFGSDTLYDKYHTTNINVVPTISPSMEYAIPLYLNTMEMNKKIIVNNDNDKSKKIEEPELRVINHSETKFFLKNFGNGMQLKENQKVLITSVEMTSCVNITGYNIDLYLTFCYQTGKVYSTKISIQNNKTLKEKDNNIGIPLLTIRSEDLYCLGEDNNIKGLEINNKYNKEEDKKIEKVKKEEDIRYFEDGNNSGFKLDKNSFFIYPIQLYKPELNNKKYDTNFYKGKSDYVIVKNSTMNFIKKKLSKTIKDWDYINFDTTEYDIVSKKINNNCTTIDSEKSTVIINLKIKYYLVTLKQKEQNLNI